MTIENHQTQSPKHTSGKTKAFHIGVWFACIGGLAVPLVLWAFMSSSMLVLGPEVGLKVGVVAENLLTMVWPTVIVLIAPGLGLGVIAGLLLLNMFLWGAVGFMSQKTIRRPFLYYGLLAFLIFGLLISNGSFIWMAFEESELPFSLIDVPTFVIAAATVTAVFILRRRHALRQIQ